jgi:hypothetical protein
MSEFLSLLYIARHFGDSELKRIQVFEKPIFTEQMKNELYQKIKQLTILIGNFLKKRVLNLNFWFY